MNYFEIIIFSFVFLIIFFLSFHLLNLRLQKLSFQFRVNSLREYVFSDLDKFIFNSEEIFKRKYLYIFRILNNISGTQTAFINLIFECNSGLNISTLKIFNFSSEIPFKIKNFEFCEDRSLKSINISIYLFNFSREEIIYLYLFSGISNLTDYNFPEDYKGATSIFLGQVPLRYLDLENFNNKIVSEYCYKNKRFEIEIFEENRTLIHCILNSTENLMSIEIPTKSLYRGKLRLRFGIFE